MNKLIIPCTYVDLVTEHLFLWIIYKKTSKLASITTFSFPLKTTQNGLKQKNRVESFQIRSGHLEMI